MIKEVYDKNSGAILFKRDEESLDLESLKRKVGELEKTNKSLELRIKKLEKIIKESSK